MSRCWTGEHPWCRKGGVASFWVLACVREGRWWVGQEQTEYLWRHSEGPGEKGSSPPHHIDCSCSGRGSLSGLCLCLYLSSAWWQPSPSGMLGSPRTRPPQVQALSLPGGGPEKIQVLVDHMPGRGDKSRRSKGEFLAAGEREASQDSGERNGAPGPGGSGGGHSLARFVSGGTVPQGLLSSRGLSQCPAHHQPGPSPLRWGSRHRPWALLHILHRAPFLCLARIAGPAPGSYPSILASAPVSATMGHVCDRDSVPYPSSLRSESLAPRTLHMSMAWTLPCGCPIP